jgi:hypothetical protein
MRQHRQCAESRFRRPVSAIPTFARSSIHPLQLRLIVPAARTTLQRAQPTLGNEAGVRRPTAHCVARCYCLFFCTVRMRSSVHWPRPNLPCASAKRLVSNRTQHRGRLMTRQLTCTKMRLGTYWSHRIGHALLIQDNFWIAWSPPFLPLYGLLDQSRKEPVVNVDPANPVSHLSHWSTPPRLSAKGAKAMFLCNTSVPTCPSHHDPERARC